MSINDDMNRKVQENKSKAETENRVDQLINTVENYTRTERHLEEHSDIGNPHRLDRATDIQGRRKSEIDNLKNTLVYGPEYSNNEEANLRENIEDTEEYIDTFEDTMSPEALENLKNKQENRRDTLDQMR